MQESNYDYLFKFVLAGEEKVGKTAIFKRFTKGEFDENNTETIGNKKLSNIYFFSNIRC